ncbi:hypothetical protein [Crassaminicella indica]|uniref:Uncharacterized protein n=1 Tax=Crassaminicella indica TaxID=2855394 RepID=A0ABX8REU0_9CLOT|nr:hypothetical protein [Crassaminicella indica]QXM06962.1 hypothetical protein KVH43_04380 [Crassaminicella indica]
MKKYYVERNGLIKKNLNICLDELITFFEQIYRYFSNKEYFDCAQNGIWRKIPYTNDEEQIIAPTLAPSPEIFFANQLQSSEIWPILQYSEDYTEEILFTVIEILYDHIAVYDYINSELKKEEPQKEFAEYINNILKMYCDGYYLEPQNGFIMKLPNEALKQQLSYKGDEMTNAVYTKLSTATEMYYRFDSNMEMKKKAINILADILEGEREGVKNILNDEYKINKNEHDKLIFSIVNGFSIRHNRADQKEDYSKEIWYDWMMQYYTSVIIAYYRLKNKYEE